jgi:hypothetical protein
VGQGDHPHRESVKKEEALTGENLVKFSQLVTTALGLVAALAWNDAIQTIFQEVLAGPRSFQQGIRARER